MPHNLLEIITTVNQVIHLISALFYSNDPLWDGQQCGGTCCAGTNSPPLFNVQLLAPTTDMIKVSICLDQRTDDEDIPVELIEIYVQ